MKFQALGNAAVKFDKSGYAALGWSVVSFGLQVAANAEAAREFVFSSSEVVTQFVTRYTQYEILFGGPEAEDEFERLVTKVYKAILLYVIALNDYLQQYELGMFVALSMPGLGSSNKSRALCTRNHTS